MDLKKEKLISITKDDLDIQSFRPGGNGGQHRDKTSNAVRIVHPPSGAVGQSSDSRSWTENRRLAFVRMVKSVKFRKWIAETFPPPDLPKQPRRRYTYKGVIDLDHRTLQEYDD